VAVATLAPSAMPVKIRPATRALSDFPAMNTITAAIAITRPGIITVRRPYPPEMWQASNRLRIKPTT
jgi:hypothetical protein